MFGGRWSKTKLPIGIDLGTRCVRMLQLERSADGCGFVAAAAARQTLPDEVQGIGDEFHAAAGEAIRRMLVGGGFAGRRVVSGLPAPAVQYKNLRLPKMPADELAAAVQWEAGDRLHLGRNASSVQFYNAGEVRQGDDLRQEIILLAAADATVEQHTQMLVDCGLEPVAIDVTPSALARCVQLLGVGADGDGDDDASRLVIEVGYSSSKVLILREGRIVFFKLIAVGGRNFDQAVAAALSISVADAADLRRRLGDADAAETIGGDADRVRTVSRQALRPVVSDLAREVGLCLRYYSVTFRGRRPGRALLMGGGSRDADLAGALSEATGLGVTPVDPLAAVDLQPVRAVVGSEAARREWAVAAGLSLRPEARRVGVGVAA